MPRSLIIGLASYVSLTVGVTWLVGPIGLIVCSAALLIAAIFIDFEAV